MIPDNFESILWQNTVIGQVVYIKSKFKNNYYVCGTGNYRVINKEKRLLKNGNSRYSFCIPTESLLIKIK